jgi:iron complex transport system ATP-binding protein
LSDIAICFQRLGHAYKLGRWIFRGYGANVRRGTVFAVLGPNGRGKTTLLKIVLGALKPTAGTVRIAGRTALVPQLFQVSFDYSVLDMVLMGRARQIGLFSQPSASDEEAAMAALRRFGMADFAPRPFHELSGGERQMVIFARTLVSEADILILDEPTSSLDLGHQVLVLDQIKRLSREDGLTVLFTTHHPHHAFAVADEVLLMLDENKFECGEAAEVLTEDNLRKLYGVDVKHVVFDHNGTRIKTFVPVIVPSAPRRAVGH